jgi:hypothetical protein
MDLAQKLDEPYCTDAVRRILTLPSIPPQ